MDPSKWLVSHEAGYAQLPAADRKAIRDFALLWSLVEFRLFGTDANRSSIIAAMSRLGGRIDAAALAAPLRHFAGRYVDGGSLNQRFDGLHLTNQHDLAMVRQVLLGTETDPVNVATALMLIVYRLRNNLFHGPKWAYGVADQRSNFRYASALMMTLMDFDQRV